jgi:hypothetical protein
MVKPGFTLIGLFAAEGSDRIVQGIERSTMPLRGGSLVADDGVLLLSADFVGAEVLRWLSVGSGCAAIV